MGRPRIKSLSYEEITAQAEKTITSLMTPAHHPLSHKMSKDQAVSRALGAFVLWEDLTKNTGNCAAAGGDKDRLFKLLVCENK
jgi:hypothetical protein